jgi:hypothetical protein
MGLLPPQTPSNGACPARKGRRYCTCGSGFRMAFDTQLRLIGPIDQQSLVRCLSPELMLVDPELASRARELLREPGETNGKGNMSTLLGTHEISSGTVLGLEPPLSPPVVHGPSAMTTAGPSAHVDHLPSPPPALRPPESSMASEPAPTPEPAPAPVAPAAEPAPGQPEQAAPPPPPPPPPPAPVQQDSKPLMAPALEPVAPQEAEPAVIELKPVTPVQDEPDIAAVAPAEPELPAMAPEATPPAPPEPVAVAPEQPIAPPPPPEPIEQALPEIQVIAPTPPPPAPVEEIAVELPVAPAPVEEIAVELPAVESLEPPAPEPLAVEEPVFELPAVAPHAGAFRVIVRLSDGDGVEVGEFRDFGTAMQGAQEVIDQFSHSNGTWPFYAGRFIRPDLIISVDVVDAAN